MGTDAPRVTDQLEDLLSHGPRPVSGQDLADLRGHLEGAAARAVALVDGHDARDLLPLRVPKGRVAALLACERHAVARHAQPFDASMAPATLRGMALDRYVLHELVAGPVADPLEDLLSMLDAQAEFATRDDVIAWPDAAAALAPLATAAGPGPASTRRGGPAPRRRPPSTWPVATSSHRVGWTWSWEGRSRTGPASWWRSSPAPPDWTTWPR